MHDGSTIVLKKLERDYDPTDRSQAFRILEESQRNNWLITGLIYVDPDQPSMIDVNNLPETALNRMIETQLRPSKESMDLVNSMMF